MLSRLNIGQNESNDFILDFRFWTCGLTYWHGFYGSWRSCSPSFSFSFSVAVPPSKCSAKCEETGIKIETHIIYEVHQEFTTAQCSFRVAGEKEKTWKKYLTGP